MIIETYGDIWSYVSTHKIIISTNTFGIMGAGIALQAKQRYPGIQKAYQSALKTMEDKTEPWWVDDYPDVILAPTKYHWSKPSPIELVESTLIKLSQIEGGPFAMPELGCGLGKLTWESTKHLYEILEPLKTDWVIVHPIRMWTGLLR